MSINVTADKLWKCMPIHACVLLPIIKDQSVGQQHSGGCIPSFDSPGTIHIKCYLSLWFWASPLKNLRPNKSSPWFIIFLINHRPCYKQRINHAWILILCTAVVQLSLYVCYIYLPVVSTCTWCCVHFVYDPMHFYTKKKKKKEKQKRKAKKTRQKKHKKNE